jgi:pimeloyl-ACP methyl ester carboxylesterase
MAVSQPAAQRLLSPPPPGDAELLVPTAGEFRTVIDIRPAVADLTRGLELEDAGSADCVDAYYRAASAAWRYLAHAEVGFDADPHQPVALQVYQQSLSRLLIAAPCHGRFNPVVGLTVQSPAGLSQVPVLYRGFAWRPGDFNELRLASDFPNQDIRRRFVNHGIGVPLVVMRVAAESDPFLRPRQPFAVTALLRDDMGPPTTDTASEIAGQPFVIELINPHVFDRAPVGPRMAQLARDLTAPLAYDVAENPRQWFAEFRQPSETEFAPRLNMLEPYQPGKIPVIFVHGLLSDPQTWVDAVNDLRAQPDLYRQFQFWWFHYPTGGALLESTAQLRAALHTVQRSFNSAGDDPALDRILLVGHSMGGLVSKMQVSASQDRIWSQLSQRSFGELRGDPEVIARLSSAVFFHPAPGVARVVFVGTPHRGSVLSRRLIGRMASALVRPSAADERFAQLVAENPLVFGGRTMNRRPTSIDLLEPESPLLAALLQMPIAPHVRTHSIIGTGGVTPVEGPSDGVVTVASARLAGVESELFVPARHSELQSDDLAIAEIARIMRLHAATPLATAASSPVLLQTGLIGQSQMAQSAW